VKAQADYAFTHNLNSRNQLAWHVGGGLLVPYGNSTIAPFEKRFYAGGANDVRGWGVRTLGPGSFTSSNSVNGFIYQCGDIHLVANVELRSKLFWLIEGAVFVDAGNIWTIKKYPDQQGGVFRFNKFLEQIALAYGVGIRLNFNYFLVRLDMGMKAHNPASGERHWPLVHPSFNRDAEFHFSVGYPF
jgi:outer membrane protein assembly factor BamA